MSEETLIPSGIAPTAGTWLLKPIASGGGRAYDSGAESPARVSDLLGKRECHRTATFRNSSRARQAPLCSLRPGSVWCRSASPDSWWRARLRRTWLPVLWKHSRGER